MSYWKLLFIKDNMPRDVYPIGGEVKTSIAFLSAAVPEKNTLGASIGQFMWNVGPEQGVVGTSKSFVKSVIWMALKEFKIWGLML
jgi:hypothetical protein